MCRIQSSYIYTLYTHMYVRMYVHIHTYIHTYIYTKYPTHTIHTYIQSILHIQYIHIYKVSYTYNTYNSTELVKLCLLVNICRGIRTNVPVITEAITQIFTEFTWHLP